MVDFPISSIPEFMLLYFSCLLSTAHGFAGPVGFLTTGYSFSMASQAAVSLLLHASSRPLLSFANLHLVIMLVYGLRIGIFLARRNHQACFKSEAEEIQTFFQGTGLVSKFFMWTVLSWLYVSICFPAFVDSKAPAAPGTPVQFWGAGIMVAGILLESLADAQKSASKQKTPGMFCSLGLYRWVRCPNYICDITFWIGNFTATMGRYNGWVDWTVSGLGLLAIVAILVQGTMELEKKHWRRYGRMPEFQKYARTVPVLLPFVPMYSTISEEERLAQVEAGAKKN